jgi:hypothetical protein
MRENAKQLIQLRKVFAPNDGILNPPAVIASLASRAGRARSASHRDSCGGTFSLSLWRRTNIDTMRRNGTNEPLAAFARQDVTPPPKRIPAPLKFIHSLAKVYS